MSDPLVEITAIVWERHETGAYGDCRFDVALDVLDVMRTVPPAPVPEPWESGVIGGLGMLTGIPVVCDDALSDGQWRLVRREYGDPPDFPRTDTVVRQGAIRC